VEIPANCELEEGRHDQIALLLRGLKTQNAEKFDRVWEIIDALYHCTNNDVDDMLSRSPVSYIPAPDILLKVIKWLFIMEDVIYWHWEGRAFLYNFFSYVVNEQDVNRLNTTLSGIKEGKIKPDKLKRLLKECGKEWIVPKC
jgi:hypothetical protein